MSRRSAYSLGQSGEDLACRDLERRGYAILARRYRSRHGEIDIVAQEGDVIVFAEVKARSTNRFGSPAEAVTLGKQRRITRMAVDFLARHRLEHQACRFDVVTVEWSGGVPCVEVYRGAFSVE